MKNISFLQWYCKVLKSMLFFTVNLFLPSMSFYSSIYYFQIKVCFFTVKQLFKCFNFTVVFHTFVFTKKRRRRKKFLLFFWKSIIFWTTPPELFDKNPLEKVENNSGGGLSYTKTVIFHKKHRYSTRIWKITLLNWRVQHPISSLSSRIYFQLFPTGFCRINPGG